MLIGPGNKLLGRFLDQALANYAILPVDVTKRPPAHGTFLHILRREWF